MRIGAVAVIGKIIGPSELAVIRTVHGVGIGKNAGLVNRFVGIHRLPRSSDEGVPVLVSDISALDGDLIRQLVLDSYVVLVNSRQSFHCRPEFGVYVRRERESAVRTNLHRG